MNDITGELHGVKYIVSKTLADKLKKIHSIDAVKEIETAIEIHVNTRSNLIKGEINELNTK